MADGSAPVRTCPPTFGRTLAEHGLELRRERATILQVNTGWLCNLACRHCHLDAGPGRSEVMPREVMAEVVGLARRHPFGTVDVTGGAPELNPDIGYLLDGLGPLAPARLFRTNLLALEGRDELARRLAEAGWSLVASLPAVNEGQVRAMRGDGVFQASLAMLRRLNELGYGPGGRPGLALHLVSNPAGAFLPPPQDSAARQFKRELDRLGVRFDTLFVFANVPLGRYRKWLERSGNLDGYLATLRARFNPAVVPGLMCRTLLSVAWDGTVYDCDFNQAAGLPIPGTPRVGGLDRPPEGTEIPTGEHCYACTAGSGFT
jgi:radical SAM/Cys-rich protein